VTCGVLTMADPVVCAAAQPGMSAAVTATAISSNRQKNSVRSEVRTIGKVGGMGVNPR
jgi:hypothetical protein